MFFLNVLLIVLRAPDRAPQPRSCHACGKSTLICRATDPATKEEQVVFFLHRWCLLLGGGSTPQAQAQRKQTVQNAREFDGKQLKECYFPFDASDATKGLGIATEWLRG